MFELWICWKSDMDKLATGVLVDNVKILYRKQCKWIQILKNLIVYCVPRGTMRVIAWRATMLAGDRSQGVVETKPRRSRGTISPASIVASLVISRIVCIGTHSILCDFGVNTSFYAYTRILSSIVVACGASHYTWCFATSPSHFDFIYLV